MELRPARPALYEAWARVGKDVRKASHQEMRSLVCAQCHTEYYFEKENGNYLHFPQEKGMTCEAAEEYATVLASMITLIHCQRRRF